MKARAKRTPRLASETAERRFWESRDRTAYVDSRDVPYQSLIKVWLEEKLSA